MRIRSNKVHKHNCVDCSRKTTCYFVHRQDTTDLLGTLCQFCIGRILLDLHKNNVYKKEVC